jgi:hypothetical protein
VFGRLRNTLWQFGHLWVLAIDADDRPTALKLPADAFFDMVVDLAPLSTDELARVLRLRSPETPAATARHVAANAKGNPRRALRALGDAVVHGVDPSSSLAARAALETQASLSGRPHGMLMAELLERGQASASDAELQRSLGMSRAQEARLLPNWTPCRRGSILPVWRTSTTDCSGRPPSIGPASSRDGTTTSSRLRSYGKASSSPVAV